MLKWDYIYLISVAPCSCAIKYWSWQVLFYIFTGCSTFSKSNLISHVIHIENERNWQNGVIYKILNFILCKNLIYVNRRIWSVGVDSWCVWIIYINLSFKHKFYLITCLYLMQGLVSGLVISWAQLIFICLHRENVWYFISVYIMSK